MNSSNHSHLPRVLLVVLDGVGWRKVSKEQALMYGDAVQYAEKPNLDFLMKQEFSRTLVAGGLEVGLRDGERGNSEVGHLTLGSGQKIPQGGAYVDAAIMDRIPFKTETWFSYILSPEVRSGRATLHFLILLSDGNVHSHQQHLHRFLEAAVNENVRSIRLHLLFDGRDVPFGSAEKYLFELKEHIATLSLICPDIQIASGGGREVITMDRYERDWNMVKLGYEVHVLGRGQMFESAEDALKAMRLKGIHNDQFIEPFVIGHQGEPVGRVKDGDSFVFLNYRGDRAIEFSEVFQEHFSHFERENFPKVRFAGLLQYDFDRQIPSHYLIPLQKPSHTLPEYLCRQGIKQWYCSETHKFGHVTYFFSGLHSQPLDHSLQTWRCIPSKPVDPEKEPAMAAYEITQATIEALYNPDYRFMLINYPNGDMLGHTAHWEGTVKGIEAVDQQLEHLIHHCTKTETCLVIVGDHGNADCLYTIEGGEKIPHAMHTEAEVPFCIWNPPSLDIELKKGPAGLSQVAATIADLMGFAPHTSWSPSLIEKVINENS